MYAEMDIKMPRDSDAVPLRQALRDASAVFSAAGIDSARLDAELLLTEALGVERGKLYLNRETSLDPRALERFNSLVSRRMCGEPVAYITGRREFWSRDFLVTPAVLVPRPETELLVEVALGLFAAEFQISDLGLRILDLGTGSGAIAVSLAKEIAGAEIWATDISSEALEVAASNARRHGAEESIHFYRGDLFDAVAGQSGLFDVIVSNPPYVRRDEFAALPRDVRDFEPRIALDGGADGLDFYRRIVGQAARHLTARGFVALEIGADMGGEAARLFAEAGCYAAARVHHDLARRDRVISARKLA
jgi:release factor glutamine methyltransferase